MLGWPARLLPGSSPVGLPGPPRTIGFQEKALGQVLDDIAVTAADGVTRWLASIKTYDLLTASKLNEEFVRPAWLQLLSDRFDLGRDFVGLVNQNGRRRQLAVPPAAHRGGADRYPPDRLAARIAGADHFDETAEHCGNQPAVRSHWRAACQSLPMSHQGYCSRG